VARRRTDHGPQCGSINPDALPKIWPGVAVDSDRIPLQDNITGHILIQPAIRFADDADPEVVLLGIRINLGVRQDLLCVEFDGFTYHFLSRWAKCSLTLVGGCRDFSSTMRAVAPTAIPSRPSIVNCRVTDADSSVGRRLGSD